MVPMVYTREVPAQQRLTEDRYPAAARAMPRTDAAPARPACRAARAAPDALDRPRGGPGLELGYHALPGSVGTPRWSVASKEQHDVSS